MAKKFQPLNIGSVPCRTSLGRYLRRCRLKLNLSQAEVARELSIAQGTYGAWEMGVTQTPSDNRLKKVAEVLGCPTKKLESLCPKVPWPKSKMGKWLWRNREALDLSRRELAKKLGLNPSRVSKLKNGPRGQQINSATARRLEKCFGLERGNLQRFVYVPQRCRPTQSALGKKVRERRTELLLSVKQLAKLTKVSHALISQIELGQTVLSSPKSNALVRRLARALKLKVSELRSLRPKRRLKRPDPNRKKSRRAQTLSRRRYRLGWTKRELAARAGVSGGLISYLEGDAYPATIRPETLSKIAEALGLKRL